MIIHCRRRKLYQTLNKIPHDYQLLGYYEVKNSTNPLLMIFPPTGHQAGCYKYFHHPSVRSRLKKGNVMFDVRLNAQIKQSHLHESFLIIVPVILWVWIMFGHVSIHIHSQLE